MSDRLGLKTKENAGKTKYSSLNLNQTYRGSKVEVATKTGTARHGLQSLGKVGVSRRVPPPANLPSLKSENSGNDPTVSLVPSGGGGWGSAKEKSEQTAASPAIQAQAPAATTSSTPPPANVLLVPQHHLQPPKVSAPLSTTQQTQPAVQNSQGQTTTTTSKPEGSTKSWGSVSNADGGQGKPYSHQPSQYFNREFPVLGGGNSGDRVPEEGQPQGYARGPTTTRRPYDHTWADKPGSGPPPADHGYSRDRDRGSTNGNISSDFTPYYNRGYDQQRGPPGRDFGGPPYLGPSRGQPPPAHPKPPPTADGTMPQRGPGPPHKGQQRPHGKGDDSKGEGYTRPPILRTTDINALDDDEDEEGGWAGAQEEVDYSAKLVFEDFGDEDGSSGRSNGTDQTSKHHADGRGDDRQRGHHGQYDPRRQQDSDWQRRPGDDNDWSRRDDDRQARPQDKDRQRRGPEEGDMQRRQPYNDWMPKHFQPQDRVAKDDPSWREPPRRTAWQDQQQSRPPHDQQSHQRQDYYDGRGGRQFQAGYERGPPQGGVDHDWQKGQPPQQHQGQQWQDEKKFRANEEMRIANERARKRREEDEKRRQEEMAMAAKAKLKSLDERKRRAEHDSAQPSADDHKSHRDLDKGKDSGDHDEVFTQSKESQKERQGELMLDDRKRNDSESSESSRSSFQRQEYNRGKVQKNLPPRFQRQHGQQQQSKPYSSAGDKADSSEQLQSYGEPVSPVSPSRSDDTSFPRRIMKRSDSGSTPDDNVSIKSVDSVGEKETSKPPRRSQESGKDSRRKYDDEPSFESQGGWQEKGEDRRKGSQDRRQDQKEDGKERWQGNKDRKQDSQDRSYNQSKWYDRKDGDKFQGRRQDSGRRQDGQYGHQDKWHDRQQDDRDQDKKQDKRQGRMQDKVSDRPSQQQSERYSDRQEERKLERLGPERKSDAQESKSAKDDKNTAPVENIWEKRKAHQETKLSQERKMVDDTQETKETEEEKERRRLRDMDVRRHLDDSDRSPPQKRESDSHDGREVKRRPKEDDRPKGDGDYDDDRSMSAGRGRRGYRVTYNVRGRGRGMTGYGGRGGRSEYSRVSRDYNDKRKQTRDNDRDDRSRYRSDDRDSWKNRGEKDTRPNRSRDTREDRDQDRSQGRDKESRKEKESKEKKYADEDTRKPSRSTSERKEMKDDGRRNERRDRPSADKEPREAKGKRDDDREKVESKEEEPRESRDTRDSRESRREDSKPTQRRMDTRDHDSRQQPRHDSNRDRYEERPGRDGSSRGRGRGSVSRGRGTSRPTRGHYDKSPRGAEKRTVGSGRFPGGSSAHHRKQEEEDSEYYTDSDDDYTGSDSYGSYTGSSFESEEEEMEAPPAKPKQESAEKPKEPHDKPSSRAKTEEKSSYQSYKSDYKNKQPAGARPQRNTDRQRRQQECPPRFLKLQESKARGRGRGATRGDLGGGTRGRGRGRGGSSDRKPSYNNDRREESSIPTTEDWEDDIDEERDKRGPPDRTRRDNSARKNFSSQRSSERTTDRNYRNRGENGDRRRAQSGKSQNSNKRDSFLAKKQQVEADGSTGSGNLDTSSPAAVATSSTSDPAVGKESTKNETKKSTAKDTKGKAEKNKSDSNKFSNTDSHASSGTSQTESAENKKNQKKSDPVKSDISHFDVNNIAKVIIIDDIVRREDEDIADAGEDGFVEVTSRRTQKEMREKMREEEERKRTEEKKKPEETPKAKSTPSSNGKKQQSATKAQRFTTPNTGTTPNKNPGVIGKPPISTVIGSAIASIPPGMRSGSSSNSSTKRNSPVVMEKPFSSPPPPMVNAWDKPLSIIAVKPTVAGEGQDPLAVGSGKPSTLLQMELEKMSLHATDQSESAPGKDDSKPDPKSDKENCQPKTEEKNRSSSKKESSKGDKKSYPGRSQKPPRFEKAGLGSKRKSEYEKESRNRGDEKPAKLPRQGSKQEKDDSNKGSVPGQVRNRNMKNSRTSSSAQKTRPATEDTSTKVKEECKESPVIDAGSAVSEETKIVKDALEVEKSEVEEETNLEEQNVSSESDSNLSTGDLKNGNDDTDALLNAGPLTVDIPESTATVEEEAKRSSSPVSPALVEMSKRMDKARAAWNATSVTSPNITSSAWEDTRINSPISSQSTSVIGNAIKDNAAVDLGKVHGPEPPQDMTKVLTSDLVKGTGAQGTFSKKTTTGEQQNVCKVKPQQQLPKPQVDLEQPSAPQSLSVVQDQMPAALNSMAFPTHNQYPFQLDSRLAQPHFVQLQQRQQTQAQPHTFLQQQQQQPSFLSQQPQLASNFQQPMAQVRPPVTTPSPLSQPQQDTRLFQQPFLQGPMYSNSLTQTLLPVTMLGTSANPTFPPASKTPGTSVQSGAGDTKPASVSAFGPAITPSPTQPLYMPFDLQNFSATSILNLNPQQPNQRSVPQQQVAPGYFQSALPQQQSMHQQNSFSAVQQLHGFMQASQAQKQRAGPFQVPSPDQLHGSMGQSEDTSSQSDLVKHINAKPFEPPKRLSTPNSGPSTPSESPGINPTSGIGSVLPIRPRPIPASRNMSVSPPSMQMMNLSLQPKPNLQFLPQQQPPRSQPFTQFQASMQIPQQQQHQFAPRPRGGMIPNTQMLANLKSYQVRTPPPVGSNTQHITTPRFPAPIQRPSSVNMQASGHVQPIQPPRMRPVAPPMPMMGKQGFVLTQPGQQMNLQRPPPPPPMPPPQQQQQGQGQGKGGQDSFKAMQRQKMIQETQKYFTEKDGVPSSMQQTQSQMLMQPQVKFEGQLPNHPGAKPPVQAAAKLPNQVSTKMQQALSTAKPPPANGSAKQQVSANGKAQGPVPVQPQPKSQGQPPVQNQQPPKNKGASKNYKPRQQSHKGKPTKSNASKESGSNKSSDENPQMKPKTEENPKTSDKAQDTTKKDEDLSSILSKPIDNKNDSSTSKEKKVYPVEPLPQRQAARNRNNRSRVPRNGSVPSGKGNNGSTATTTATMIPATTTEPADKASAPVGKEAPSKSSPPLSESKSSKPVITGIELATLQT